MPAEIRITRNFEDNLDRIREFLLQVSPEQAAQRLTILEREVVAACSLLAAHPAIGRSLHGATNRKLDLALRQLQARTKALGAGELREWIVGEYTLLYAGSAEAVHLLALKHQRQLAYLL